LIGLSFIQGVVMMVCHILSIVKTTTAKRDGALTVPLEKGGIVMMIKMYQDTGYMTLILLDVILVSIGIITLEHGTATKSLGNWLNT